MDEPARIQRPPTLRLPTHAEFLERWAMVGELLRLTTRRTEPERGER